jgi:hypothetical protein
MTPDSYDRTTAVPPAAASAPPALRLRLDPTMARGGALDGGWWPRSKDPDAELPDLIAGLESSLGPITRVALNLDAWDGAPRRVAVDGRRIHVGWFRHMDADTIGVTRGSQARAVLLVVPPQATTAAAQIAMAMAADATNSARPADILAAAGIGAVPRHPGAPLRQVAGPQHPFPASSSSARRSSAAPSSPSANGSPGSADVMEPLAVLERSTDFAPARSRPATTAS